MHVLHAGCYGHTVGLTEWSTNGNSTSKWNKFLPYYNINLFSRSHVRVSVNSFVTHINTTDSFRGLVSASNVAEKLGY